VVDISSSIACGGFVDVIEHEFVFWKYIL
jgi:hypothetical protein